jgi:predicted phosphohydrolase
MKIWGIADLHLSFGVENKSMEVFGPHWKEHAHQIKTSWERLIDSDDLVLIPGDISWALRLEEALPDLKWIDQLPGTKVLLKGNHDFWWGSLTKMAPLLPPSIHLIQNNCFLWKGAAIGGARLWDTSEYSFGPFIELRENPHARPIEKEEGIQEDLNEKIFQRELQRLEMSLSKIPPDSSLRIAMTHYPPIGADLKPSRASELLEKHRIDLVVFGHLHNIRGGLSLFGEKNGVHYILAAADYLHFQPQLLFS